MQSLTFEEKTQSPAELSPCLMEDRKDQFLLFLSALLQHTAAQATQPDLHLNMKERNWHCHFPCFFHPLLFFLSFSLSVSFCWQGYYFHTDNPCKDLPNAFEEGLKKSREGDLQNAVLLLEAAVLQDPHDSEVNPFSTPSAGSLAATITLALFQDYRGRHSQYSQLGMWSGQKEEPHLKHRRPLKLQFHELPTTIAPLGWERWRRKKLSLTPICVKPTLAEPNPLIAWRCGAFICLSLKKLFTVAKEKRETFSWLQFPSAQCSVNQIMAHSAGFLFFCCSFTLCVSQGMTSWQAEGAKPSHTKCSQKSPGIHRNVPVIPRRGLSRSVWN